MAPSSCAVNCAAAAASPSPIKKSESPALLTLALRIGPRVGTDQSVVCGDAVKDRKPWPPAGALTEVSKDGMVRKLGTGMPAQPPEMIALEGGITLMG